MNINKSVRTASKAFYRDVATHDAVHVALVRAEAEEKRAWEKTVAEKTCGVTTVAGHACLNWAAGGSRRCALHMNRKKKKKPRKKKQKTCGVNTGNACKKLPVPGRVRCVHHRGMKV